METSCIAIIHYQLVSLNFHGSHTHMHILRKHKNVCISTHKDRGKNKHEHTTNAVIHLLQTVISLSFLFAHLFDEIGVAMP